MARKNPDQAHASAQQWSDKQVDRLQNYMTESINHVMGRNTRVAQLLCYISLMAANGDIDRGAKVAVQAAVWQNYKSQGGRQAAHYLPGQLKINGAKLSDLTDHVALKLAIRRLFGDVDDLPADFNKADTQAEAKGKDGGLCEALQKAAIYVITNTTTDHNIDRSVVRQAYQQKWKLLAKVAYNNALKSKSEKYTKPPLKKGTAGGIHFNTILNLDERESASAYQRRIDNQKDILRHYLHEIDQDPLALLDIKIDSLVGALSA